MLDNDCLTGGAHYRDFNASVLSLCRFTLIYDKNPYRTDGWRAALVTAGANLESQEKSLVVDCAPDYGVVGDLYVQIGGRTSSGTRTTVHLVLHTAHRHATD